MQLIKNELNLSKMISIEYHHRSREGKVDYNPPPATQKKRFGRAYGL